MPDPERTRVAEVLAEICQAIGADGGGSVYLDGGDSTLELVASTGPQRPRSTVLARLRGKAHELGGSTLVLRIDGVNGGIAVLRRRSAMDFTQQDRAVARLYARRLADSSAAASGALAKSSWTRQLESIQRICARLTRLASVEEVASTICSEISQLVDHDEAHVLLVDDTGVLRPVAATCAAPARPTGVRRARGRSGHTEIPPLPSQGEGAITIGQAVRSGVPTLVALVESLGPGRDEPHSMLIVPLQFESRVTGLICLIARGGGRFDDDDLRLIQILSDQAAVAIENARLLQGRDALVQELAGLLEISGAAASAQDERTLAALLCTRLRQLTNADGALLARWDEGSTVMDVIVRDGLAGDGQAIDVSTSPARRSVLREGRPLVSEADGLILVPLNAGGRTIGLVELVTAAGPRTPTPAEMQACEAMASLAAAGLEKLHVVEQLRAAADIDLVSGVHNHRYLQERLRQEIARSARSHAPLAVLMLDLDKFKPINDRHGHADGDRVLHNIATTIRAHLRTNDIVARYGGDEFVVLMPDTSPDRADQVARRVVAGVLQQQHELSDRSHVSVGVSAGLSVFPDDGRNSAQLLAAADAAMYAAKRGGGRHIERAPIAVPGAPTGPRLVEKGEPLAARAVA